MNGDGRGRSGGDPRSIGDILSDRINSPSFPAIPTVYGDIEFRSRLEATWAAFFDACGWKWSYEPEEQKGWIPDFTLGYKPTFVEVKPFRRIEEWGPTIRKICNSGVHRKIVLLGADPTFFDAVGCFETSAPQIGWLLDIDGIEAIPWDLHFGFTEGESDEALGLCSLEGGWWNVIWNYDGFGRANKLSRVWPHSNRSWAIPDGESLRDTNSASELLRAYWLIGRNATQWKPQSRND